MKNTTFQTFKSYVYILFREESQNKKIYKNKNFNIVGISSIYSSYAREFVVELKNQNNQFARINLDVFVLKEWWHETNYINQLYTKEVEEKGEYKPELLEKAYNDFIYDSLERIINLMEVFSYDD